MLIAAVVALEIFAAVAMADGLYFHLVKYRLFARKDSRYEHLLHTIHAVFFPALVVLLFLRAPSGAFLWGGVALVAVDFVVEMMDVVCERASRRSIGGLSTGEYAVHVLAITSRGSAFTLALAARPAAAWLLSNTTIHDAAISPLSRVICWLIAAGGVAMAALHIWLMLRSADGEAAESAALP